MCIYQIFGPHSLRFLKSSESWVMFQENFNATGKERLEDVGKRPTMSYRMITILWAF